MTKKVSNTTIEDEHTDSANTNTFNAVLVKALNAYHVALHGTTVDDCTVKECLARKILNRNGIEVFS